MKSNTRLNTETFIQKSNITHNFKYNYDKTVYTLNSNKVIVTCKEHGDFEIRAQNHSGKQANGCPACSNLKKLDLNEFIKRSNKIHDFKYDYSLAIYKGHKHKINIVCKNHGIFSISANSHLFGNGCEACSYVERGIKHTYSTLEFINKAKLIHNDLYDYSETNYTHNKHKLNIICSKHGVFTQIANNHIQGAGCPNCNTSKGEIFISNWLNINNIKFESQKKFSECKNTKPLPFDFYLPDYDLLIEYNGIQHYKDTFKFKSNLNNKNKSFENRQYLDNIKRNYAADKHNYLEISYLDDIEEKLKECIK